MLSPSTYDVWKDITLNFNPRDVYVSEPSDTSTPAPPKTPRRPGRAGAVRKLNASASESTAKDLAFYPEYVPSSVSSVQDISFSRLLNEVDQAACATF